MSSTDHAFAGTDHVVAGLRNTSIGSDRRVGAHRSSDDTDRVRMAQRWAVGVLSLATTALAVYLALVVAATWLVVSALDALTARQSGTLDVVAVLADVAPGLLVGWCLGLAATTVIARGEGLGARVAGIASGVFGATAGAAMLALTGVL